MMPSFCFRLWLPLVAAAALLAQPAALPPPMPAQPPKPAQKMPDGEAERALRYYLERRMGPGATDLPQDRYEKARQHTARMRAFSLARGRYVEKSPSGATENLTVDWGAWTSLGPGNQGGRSKALLVHPTNPDIMYTGGVTGGVWKTEDGGQSWRPLADLFPTIGIGAMAFDPTNPDIIYAGTGFYFNSLSGTNVYGAAPRGSGLFKSTDAGQTWTRLNAPEGTAFRFINAIHVSRQDSNRLYVASFGGVFRSTDGGQSWTLTLRPPGNTTGCTAMVARTDVETDYLFSFCGRLAGERPAIYRNRDAGNQLEWEVVHQPGNIGNTTLALAPSSQNVIYALASSIDPANPSFSSGLFAVYRSTVNGDPDTWEERVTNRDPNPLNTALLSSNSGFFGPECQGTLTRSISSQGWIHNAIAVDPLNPRIVFVGGIDIYRSDDGGTNWGIASFWQAADGPNGAHADVLGFAFHPRYDGEGNQTLFVAGDGGIYRTPNARAATAQGPRAGCTPFQNRVIWEPLHGGYVTTQFYYGAVYPGGAAYLGGKQDNGTMRGTDAQGPLNWVRIRGGDGAAVAVDPRDANNVWVSTQNFGYVRSINGGKVFATGTRGISESAFQFIAPVGVDPTNAQRQFAGGRRLWRTTDGAANWTPVSAQLPAAVSTISAVAVSPSDPRRVVFGTTAGAIFRVENADDAAGDTEHPSALPRTGHVSSLAFDPTNADIVYATYSQFNTNATQQHVYKSTDGGRTWQGIDGTGANSIPDVPVLSVMVDPLDRQRVYLGTDLGILVSPDGGATWARDVNPFANVVTETLILNRDAGVTQLVAFTFGRGVWRAILPDSGTPCEYRLSGAIGDVPAFGGEGSLSVDTGENCVWSALPQSAALDVVSPATGRGPGQVRFQVSLNTSAQRRPVAATLQNQSLTSTQAGAAIFSGNDARANATPITALPYVGVQDTRPYTAAADDPSPSCAGTNASTHKTAWFRFQAPRTGVLQLNVQGQRYDIFGNSGVVVTAYAESDLTRELGCVLGPRDTGPLIFSNMGVAVLEGQTYLIQVGATGSTPQDGGYTVVAATYR